MIRPQLSLVITLATLLVGGCRFRYELMDAESNAASAGTSSASGTTGTGGSGGTSSGGSAGTAGDAAGTAGAAGAADAAGAGQGGTGPLPCVDLSTYPGGGFYKEDISEVSGMTLNGFAASIDGVLRLKPIQDSGGSAYVDEAFSVDSSTSVFAHFSLQIAGGDETAGADGMAFVMQTTGPNALGVQGGGLGYDGIVPSVAIEFDTFELTGFDPDDNHIALTQNGVNFHLATVTPAFDINDGVRRYVWIAFDGALDLLEVFVSDTPTLPATPILTHAGFDPSAVLVGPTYLGFSASSGNFHNNHDLLGEAWLLTSPLGRCR